MRILAHFLLALTLIGCDQKDAADPAPVPNTRIATENFVNLPTIGCPGGEFLAIVPLFRADIKDRSDISAKLRRIPYSSNEYLVPETWWPGNPVKQKTSLVTEVGDAWTVYRDFLAESGRPSVRNFNELSEISGGIDGLQRQSIEIPPESIEAVAEELIDAEILTAAAQAPVGCGAADNIGFYLASYSGDPRIQPEALIPYIRSRLDQKLLEEAGDGFYSISEIGRSSVSGSGLPQSFQSVVFQIRVPSEILTPEADRWVQAKVAIQTLGFNPGDGLLLNIFADDARTAARTIRVTPPTEYEFDAENLEQEIANQISEFLR